MKKYLFRVILSAAIKNCRNFSFLQFLSTMWKNLALMGLVVGFFACGDDSNSTSASGSSGEGPSSSVKDESKYDETANTLTDLRDGNVYLTVVINDQIWMAENLNFKGVFSLCYDYNPEMCAKYGALYTWVEAMEACPTGWRLPSKDEFDQLQNTIEATGEERSLNLRHSNWSNGADAFGFSALPAGYRYAYKDGSIQFLQQGTGTIFWSSSEIDEKSAYGMSISLSFPLISDNKKVHSLSVRCVKN